MFSNVNGFENTPVLKVLLTFSTIDVVNSKLPCVKPPPSTSWKPTKSGENDSLPAGGDAG